MQESEVTEKIEERAKSKASGNSSNFQTEKNYDKRVKNHCKFKFETHGGDAYLLNQAHRIDLGIKREKRKLKTEFAKKMKKIHNKLIFLKYLCMFILFSLTQFERIEWCVRLTYLSDSEET